MRQYFEAKRQYRDAIVFFRMGDFYEMFYEDALVAARALELTLTSRSKDASGGSIPMCGVPYHAVDGYLAKLVKKGFRVAICEQVEDPEEGQGAGAARGRPRGVARDAHRRRLSRRPGARVPDGDRARAGLPASRQRAGRTDAPGGRRRAHRPLDRRVPDGGVLGGRRPAGALRRDGGAAPARAGRSRRVRAVGVPAGHRRARHSDHPGRRVGLRAGSRPVVPARAVPDEEPGRLRPRAAPAGGAGRRRAGALPARHAEGRPRARPHGELPADVRHARSSIP